RNDCVEALAVDSQKHDRSIGQATACERVAHRQRRRSVNRGSILGSFQKLLPLRDGSNSLSRRLNRTQEILVLKLRASDFVSWTQCDVGLGVEGLINQTLLQPGDQRRKKDHDRNTDRDGPHGERRLRPILPQELPRYVPRKLHWLCG